MSDLAWRAEAACHRAWPTAVETVLDGWLLRTGGGPTWRLNALHPLPDGPRDPGPVLAEADARLARVGKPLTVRVPTLASGLDAALDAHGFGPAERQTLVLAASLTIAAHNGRVTLTERPTAAWLGARTHREALDAGEAE